MRPDLQQADKPDSLLFLYTFQSKRTFLKTSSLGHKKTHILKTKYRKKIFFIKFTDIAIFKKIIFCIIKIIKFHLNHKKKLFFYAKNS